jgi:hypothetical protein
VPHVFLPGRSGLQFQADLLELDLPLRSATIVVTKR